MIFLTAHFRALQTSPQRLVALFWRRSLSLIALLCLIASPALAATYTDNGDGTVTDPGTGLTWMRCAMGQTWTGSTCSGTAGGYAWAQALALTATFAGHSDWRLPNARELQTIVDRTVYVPALDRTAFPNTPSWSFWSVSPYVSLSNYAWGVSFGDGYVSYFRSSSIGYGVRLVRGGQPLGLLDPARPTSDYVDHGNGTVTHTPTGLMWKRCAEGQAWSGSDCAGSAAWYNWDTARGLTSAFAGSGDWRLPTEEELLSLVDYTKSSPAINATLFPGASYPIFWSGSPMAADSNNAWGVDFSGGTGTYNDRGNGLSVRLVRAGQPLGSFALTVSATGSGSVSSAPAGISCGSTCSASYSSGTSVVLTATPVSGSSFAGWGGACSGTATTCTLSLTAAQSVTASFAGSVVPTSYPLTLAPGWNLLGNSLAAPITVATTFGDANTVTTVWKWDASRAGWQFYAPSMDAATLQSYTASKGYGVLSAINPGEGYWVNAKVAAAFGTQTGTAFNLVTGTLATGWNLAATGNDVSPSAFNTSLSASPPAPGTVPINFTTLWAWNNGLSQWHFYAPSLESNGGLASYIAGKGYLDFTSSGKTLGNGTGFWVNKP